MKNYEVKVLRFFTDKLENVERNVGDTFLCDKERYEFLKKNNAVELVGIQVTIEDVEKDNVEEVTIKQDKEFGTEIKKEDLEKKDEVVEKIITKKKKTSKK